MKTNVSIKFNSIEEYRVIEKKLEEMGYVNSDRQDYTPCYKECFIVIYTNVFKSHLHDGVGTNKTYNNLEEFLNN